MKPRQCVICRRESDLFSFPKNESQRKKWADELKIDFNSIKLSMDKVCKAHFSAEQFKYNSQKRLKTDAVPSLHVIDDSEQITVKNECTPEIQENDENRKHMYILCGFVSASCFYRFPKNPLLRKQWATFCEMSPVEVKDYHRLCNKHFHIKNKSDKIPTLYPREYSKNKEPVQNSIIDINGRNDIEPEGENIMSECDDVHNSENICETFTQESKTPFIYFRRYGDITEKDVATPRRAALALRMGKSELVKCRKKIKLVQTENYKLKLKISSLQKRLVDLEKINLISQSELF